MCYKKFMKYKANTSYSSEKILIEKATIAAQKMRLALRGLPIGALIKSIRKQLRMSQIALAKRAAVPQSTISRIEKGKSDLNLSTLYKILRAISCDLVIAPLLLEPVDSIRKKQAKKIAEKRVLYLKGTMNLEDQQPDSRFI